MSDHSLVDSLSWVIGGAQGSGVDSGANIFSKSCARIGFHVFGKREFYSNIKGEHSYFAVRISNKTINSVVDDINVLVSFDAETVFRHADKVVPGGSIIYDTSLSKITLNEIPTMDDESNKHISKMLMGSGYENSVNGMLNFARSRGCDLFGLPYSEMVMDLAGKINEPSLGKLSRTINILAVSASFALLNLDKNQLLDAIKHVFHSKPKILSINIGAAEYAYSFIKEKFKENKIKYDISINSILKDHLLIQGSYATAIGKIVGGCRFQTYYPITPASEDSEFLESNQNIDLVDGKHGSIVVVQTEDEIAAITMAIGGALTGARSATATSGPGFSLMAEALGWTGMNEVPLVVTMYQRAGPSTGLPTRHEQSDLLFAIHAGHGEFPRIVYASGDIEESFYDSIKVFNFAEQFQLPVIHLLDKLMASSIMTIKNFDLTNVIINRGKFTTDINVENSELANNYLRFKFEDDHISTRVPLGTPNGIFWNTGDEHNEEGHITEDPEVRGKMMEKRMGKLDTVLKKVQDSDKIIYYDFPNSNNKFVVVSWGSTKGSIIDALEKLSQEGMSMGFVQLKLLHPFPSDSIEKLLNGKILIDIEMNLSSQLGNLLKQNLTRKPDYLIVKYNGRGMSSNEVHDALNDILKDKAPRRIVLTNGT